MEIFWLIKELHIWQQNQQNKTINKTGQAHASLSSQAPNSDGEARMVIRKQKNKKTYPMMGKAMNNEGRTAEDEVDGVTSKWSCPLCQLCGHEKGFHTHTPDEFLEIDDDTLILTEPGVFEDKTQVQEEVVLICKEKANSDRPQ